MSRTYRATGINLKSIPLGENDRLITILTREYGLVRAIAAGSRKHQSRLGGRSGLFVVNDLLIARGKSLDKITQAETLESYPKLGQDLKKLTAGQYLAELTLYQAYSDQPQEELFCLLNDHLARLETLPSEEVLPHLTHAIFQFLVVAGVSPQLHACCVTQKPLMPDFHDPDWRVGFSGAAGGIVVLEELPRFDRPIRPPKQGQSSRQSTPSPMRRSQNSSNLVEGGFSVTTEDSSAADRYPPVTSVTARLNATELFLLQQLTQAELPSPATILSSLRHPEVGSSASEPLWRSVERLLRRYAEYHFERPIRSAALIDACFAAVPSVPTSSTYDATV